MRQQGGKRVERSEYGCGGFTNKGQQKKEVSKMQRQRCKARSEAQQIKVKKVGFIGELKFLKASWWDDPRRGKSYLQAV